MTTTPAMLPITDLPESPAAERNKQPLLEQLQRLLPPQGRMLELASGTGQHAVWFAAGLPGWTWQPTEASADALPVIATRTRLAGLTNVRPPCLLDATDAVWPSDDETLARDFAEPFDALFCANLLHIAPWAVCAGLMQGAARSLRPDGRLLVYGPLLEGDVPTAQGNLDFDASLRRQNPEWGIRQREAVERCAHDAGFRLRQRIPMPANNLLLVFGRG